MYRIFPFRMFCCLILSTLIFFYFSRRFFSFLLYSFSFFSISIPFLSFLCFLRDFRQSLRCCPNSSHTLPPELHHLISFPFLTHFLLTSYFIFLILFSLILSLHFLFNSPSLTLSFSLFYSFFSRWVGDESRKGTSHPKNVQSRRSCKYKYKIPG